MRRHGVKDRIPHVFERRVEIGGCNLLEARASKLLLVLIHGVCNSIRVKNQAVAAL